MRSLLLHITLLLAIGSALVQEANAQCNAGFNDSIDSLTVYFTSTASGSYDVIEYDYGDGGFDVGVANPTHTYSEEGIYEVCQFVYDTLTFTCFDWSCDTLYIGNATCQADFWWFPDGLELEFYSYALGFYDSLSWDFGDGNTSNDTLPIHEYDSAGYYTVCLSLFDTAGSLCDSACITLFVDSSSCEADFDYDADGLTVDFTNLSSGGYNAVEWDFGDGFGFSEDEDPSYTYFVAGTYEVCLYIYDTLSWTCYDELCVEITVTAGGGGSGCEADFSYETEELMIECTDESTGNYITTIWDFGDGSTPGFDAFHTYEEPGTYEVCLTVGNVFPFCFDQYCQEVTVYDFNCEPDFSYSYNPASNVFSFANTTTVGVFDEVKWEFGDGNSSSFANPSYTYNVPGEYEVCLSTYSEGNLCGFTCKVIQVFPLGVNEGSPRFMRVFPNPSKGNFLLDRGELSGVAQVTLSDLSGREITRQITNRRMVQLDYNVAAGAYLLQVRNEFGEVEVAKIIVE